MNSVVPSDPYGNCSYDWEQFDCDQYVYSNYSSISESDRIILELLVDYHKNAPLGGSMVEIGAGPNLYPLLAASVFRENIYITDISVRNLQYLKHLMAAQIMPQPWPIWLAEVQNLHIAYDALGRNSNSLLERCTFEQRSIYDLSEDRFDFSSMHFVAESITNDYEEFEAGCAKAVRCLRYGGTFVASFMLSSKGYSTGTTEFPAVAVNAEQICDALNTEGTIADYRILEGPEYVVRQGHTGILVVKGHR